MTIRHIVLSGGAYNGMCILGALEHLNTNKFYDIRHIRRSSNRGASMPQYRLANTLELCN